MFTGIIEAVGRVTGVDGDADARRLTFESALVADSLPIGASISVDGACLTAVEVAGVTFSVDAVVETLDRTTLGSLSVGDGVNLERAMPAGGRFDGHVVQGHVDGTALIDSIAAEGEGQRWRISAPESLLRYVVEKGSITMDGVSLTVAALGSGWFEVALIPHTLELTTFGSAAVGDAVNLEVDILAKYVERLLETPE